MKKRILGGILALFLMLTLFMSAPLSLSAAEPEAFGTTRTSVTPGKTYTISTQEELARFSLLSNPSYYLNYYSVTILLTADITITNDYDLTSSGNWTPIDIFYGTFDGEGHTVTIQCSNNNPYLGFISLNYGVVKNLTVAGSVSQVNRICSGGISGINYGTIFNCGNTADIHDIGSQVVGGIAGMNYGSIMNCCNFGTIIGSVVSGGIVGYSSQVIFNCYNSGTVTGVEYVGAISGYISNTTVANCYYLLSSCSKSVGISYNGTMTNCIGFDTAGTLSSPVGGTADLLKALNNWVYANQTASADYWGWKAGLPYPILTIEPVIMTETLDTAVQSYPYSVSLGAVSISTASWSLTGGTLPPGLALTPDGAITGTPTTGGIFNFTVSVQNGLGTASKALSLKVLSLQTPIAFTGIPASVTYGDIFTVGTTGGSGTGGLTLGISNETDLRGNPTTGVAIIGPSGLVKTLKAGNFQITAAKAGDSTYTDCSAISQIITVNQKSVTVSGIGAADKDYDGSEKAALTGLNTAVLNRIINGDIVSLDTTNAVAYFTDSTAGAGKVVNFSGFALKGADAANYSLTQPNPVKANIRQANPPYTLPWGLTATQGQTLTNITLPKDAYGVFTFDDPLTTSVGTPGEHNFTATYTPFDTVNYKTLTGIVLVIKVKAAASSSAAASATSKPTDTASSEATSSGTNSSVPASSGTGSDVSAPQMGSSASYLPLLVILMLLSSAAILVILLFRKSRKS